MILKTKENEIFTHFALWKKHIKDKIRYIHWARKLN